MVLAYTGTPRNSGYSNWDMFRRFIEGDNDTVRLMRRIASIAGRMRDALVDGDLDEVGRLLGEEGRLRSGLAPSVSTPRIETVSTAARRAGALGVKVCGAGGGGCVVAFARDGATKDVARAIERAGAHVLRAPIARSGLSVRASLSER